MSPKRVFDLLKDTFKEWSQDHASTLAAALAYYAVFSIGPLLLILVSMAGLVFGQKAAEGQLVGQIQGWVGPQTANTVQSLLQAAYHPRAGLIGTAIGVVTLVFGAIGFFGQLQSSLNMIWEAKPPSSGIREMVKQRALTFLMVVLLGVLLIVLLVLGAVVTAAVTFFGSMLPASFSGFLPQAAELVLSFAVITLVIGAVFRLLPDTTVAWSDVWIGAAITALLFTAGKLGLSFYLGREGVTSAYGAAGSLVVLMLWVYYSAQIFFVGAEFTQVYANKYGPRAVPQKNAAGPADREAPMSPEDTAERGPVAEGNGSQQQKEPQKNRAA
ncbi:MAG: YihY/virulence factor BrkB family protein [Chloroflexi bacterium]|nr:YihY/virulence factor BrkB family protein [Chloroflexota bacterium]